MAEIKRGVAGWRGKRRTRLVDLLVVGGIDSLSWIATNEKAPAQRRARALKIVRCERKSGAYPVKAAGFIRQGSYEPLYRVRKTLAQSCTSQ